MFWRVLAVGAACVLILHSTGCENMDKVTAFLSAEPETSSSDRLVNVPIEQVVITTQNTMSALSYAATTSRHGDEVRLSAKNSLGYRFTVILTPVHGKDGEQTRAHIEWE